MIHVTSHAIDRYIERIRTCSRADAQASIAAHEPAIEKAAQFGCSTVITHAARLVLDGTRVVTVTERRTRRATRQDRHDLDWGAIALAGDRGAGLPRERDARADW